LEKLVLSKKLVVFDLDGTLINSSEKIYLAVCLTREEFKFSQSNKEFIFSKIGLSAEELFLDLNLNSFQLELVVKQFRFFLENINFSNNDLYPKVVETLNLLKLKKYLLAIATNKPSSLAKKALADCGIETYFDLIRGSDGLPLKPDPAILTNCLSYFDVPSSSTIMIGDRTEDMKAAYSVGIYGIGLTQGTCSENDLKRNGAHKVFDDIENLHYYFQEYGVFENI
jgi:phosphoglycolate phosphatase